MGGFSLQGGEAGASAGGAAGPWGALAGGIIGGFFGGPPQMTPEQKWLFDFQKSNATQMQQFANSVPGSSPGEMAAMAQQRGMLGEEQRGAQARLGNAMPFMAGNSNLGDLLSNLSSQQVGQRGALTAQFLQQALQRRQDALLQSSQIASGAYAPAAAARVQQPDVGGALAKFAQMYAQNKAQNAGGGGGGVSNGTSNTGGGPTELSTPQGTGMGGFGFGGVSPQNAGPAQPMGPMPGMGQMNTGLSLPTGFQGLLPSQMAPQAVGPGPGDPSGNLGMGHGGGVYGPFVAGQGNAFGYQPPSNPAWDFFAPRNYGL